MKDSKNRIFKRVTLVRLCCLTFLFICLFQIAVAQKIETDERRKAKLTFRQTLNQLAKDKDRAKASKGFLAAIKEDNTYALPRYNLGVMAEADERWDDAIKWFEEFLKLSDDAKYIRSAKLELEKIKRIKELDKTPAGKSKRQYDELIAVANLQHKLGLAKESISTAAKAAEMSPDRWEAYVVVANALMEQKQWTQAVKFIQMAMKSAPKKVKETLKKALDECTGKQQTLKQ